MTTAAVADAQIRRGGQNVILCADDFAIAEGVSAGIEELAAAGRLSATSAIVTLPRWPADATRLARLADRLAIGLHINLTLGAPLGAMPDLAPNGHLPSLALLTSRALLGRIDAGEIAAEVSRQIEAFRRQTGREPDFLDGHQHTHALPRIRDGVLMALDGAFPAARPLVRHPADRCLRILARGAATGKSMLIGLLATGFGNRLRAAGFPTNDGFSGVSSFNQSKSYATELSQFLSHPGPRHLVMCHPGRADGELAALDPVASRREDELAAIAAFPGLSEIIWHPRREAGAGATLKWPGGEGAPC